MWTRQRAEVGVPHVEAVVSRVRCESKGREKWGNRKQRWSWEALHNAPTRLEVRVCRCVRVFAFLHPSTRLSLASSCVSSSARRGGRHCRRSRGLPRRTASLICVEMRRGDIA